MLSRSSRVRSLAVRASNSFAVAQYAAIINSNRYASVIRLQSTHAQTTVQPPSTTATATPTKPIYICTPIFYVNGKPHIGHVYTAVIADAFSRYLRVLHNKQTYFLTGTDEHGIKVQEAAEAAALLQLKADAAKAATAGTAAVVLPTLTAAEVDARTLAYCDTISDSFKQLFIKTDIAYDRYIRTTEAEHLVAVQHIWQQLQQNNHIYSGQHQGYYSKVDECFVTETQTAVDPLDSSKRVTVDGGYPVQFVSEKNYKFKLSALHQLIEQYVSSTSADGSFVVQPSNKRAEIIAWLRAAPLEDISVSRPRSRVSWGITVPTDADHTVYVWLDALTIYLTGARYPAVLPAAATATTATAATTVATTTTAAATTTATTADASLASLWPCDYHIIGKDILRFHSVYWPAFLAAAALPLPSHIIVHGHWQSNKQKMSKSLGNVIDPHTLLDSYGVDSVRYFLLAQGALADDNNYSDIDMNRRHNELADLLGNMLLRVTSKALLKTTTIPPFMPVAAAAAATTAATGTATAAAPQLVDPLTAAMVASIDAVAALADAEYSQLHFSVALELIFSLLRECNSYITAKEPWLLVKTDSSHNNTVINTAMQCVRVCAILLQPVIPRAAAQVLLRLGVAADERSLADAKFNINANHTVVADSTQLFPKLQQQPQQLQPVKTEKFVKPVGSKKAKKMAAAAAAAEAEQPASSN